MKLRPDCSVRTDGGKLPAGLPHAGVHWLPTWLPACLPAFLATLFLASPVLAAAAGDAFTLQPQTLREDMLRPWLRQSQRLAWPAAGKPPPGQAFGWSNTAGWQFQVELKDQPPAPYPSAPAIAGLPLLGDNENRPGSLLAGRADKSFGPWTVRLGLKQQQSAEFGSLRKPAISVVYRPQESGPLAGLSMSRASRSPGFYAMGHPYGGNAEAGPEKSQQAELFFANGEHAHWRTRMTLFQAYYRDMMDFDGGPPPSLVNRARVYMRGVETSVSRRWPSGATAYLHAASIASYDPDSGLDLRFRPRQQATGGFAMPLYGPLHVHASLTWFGRRYDTAGAGAAAGLGGYAETGVMLSWKTRSTQAFLAVDNLFDRKSEEFPDGWGAGRRLRLGLKTPF
ncbi:TonB-dependent receptor domain-containing protein [Lacisediminimonas profundi]|uniref:TonB-dependent receptor domain-containing protein n=1 Tax=Lacisediminimonas profundi TaxID=2603856 RepID=UPI00124B496B|nr:TonB-dependent receptor [Lacisediminimonas profundi]